METKTIAKVGFYAALLTALLTVGTFVIAFLTPPLSGPFCAGGCFTYPYLDIASRFPKDYYCMYPAMVLNLVYYILMVAIHYFAPADKKILSHIGVSLALLSMATFNIDYSLQVSVIQPSLVLSETDGIALLSQFNAHGVFILLEEIAFIMMSPVYVRDRLPGDQDPQVVNDIFNTSLDELADRCRSLERPKWLTKEAKAMKISLASFPYKVL
jgi:hypothetical protein